MNKKLFAKLVSAVEHMRDVELGTRKPSRVFEVKPESIKELRASLKLSQPKFAALLNIEVGTLRNWEQGIRTPTGPAQALLTAIRRDPVNVLKALAAEAGD